MRLQLIAAHLALALLASTTAFAQTRILDAKEPDRATEPRPARRVVRASFETSAYADTDHIGVLSPTVAGTIADEVAGWSVSGRYLVDVVSAASVDIVSTASGRWSEQRHVGSATGTYQRGNVGISASGGVSREPDYLAVSGGARVTLDLLNKNLTPHLGLSYGHNDVGRAELAMSRWQRMQSLAVQTGATFVLDRATIAGAGIDVISEWGYLAKPYRAIPIFAPGTHVPAGASVELVNSLRSDIKPPEQLPRERYRFAVTGRLAHRFDHWTVRGDERVYADTWGMWASTTDARALWDVSDRLVLWPHLRFHGQTGASFWKRAYTFVESGSGASLPMYRTGDRELSWLYTITAGGGAKLRLSSVTSAPWFLSLEADVATTHYPDALFLTQRSSIFSAVTLDAEWD